MMGDILMGMSTRSARTFEAIGLQPVQWKAVEKRAKQAGTSPVEYVRGLIEQDLLADRSFDEILRPFRRDIKRAGVTERKLDEIVDRARRGKSAPSKVKSRTKRR